MFFNIVSIFMNEPAAAHIIIHIKLRIVHILMPFVCISLFIII